ncbi:tyrosine-type recombinase/integrase [Mesorhizobium sp.]|uniref:tyrosine-type recombinase/integrase n=1 Tax=Mesorhizobium sp. TaxID=1871066 RepID=UPI00257CAA53|nr:tyrosine-type recombinase/integrase [Mesorhizobium sp.]
MSDRARNVARFLHVCRGPDGAVGGRTRRRHPRKRRQTATTCYLERDEVEQLFDGLPRDGKPATREKALLMFLYNTGTRATEVIGLTVDQLVLTSSP